MTVLKMKKVAIQIAKGLLLDGLVQSLEKLKLNALQFVEISEQQAKRLATMAKQVVEQTARVF